MYTDRIDSMCNAVLLVEQQFDWSGQLQRLQKSIPFHVFHFGTNTTYIKIHRNGRRWCKMECHT